MDSVFRQKQSLRKLFFSEKKSTNEIKPSFLLFDGLKREKKRIKEKRIESEFV